MTLTALGLPTVPGRTDGAVARDVPTSGPLLDTYGRAATDLRVSLTDRITGLALERYNAREEELGEDLMGALERFLLLQIIDERWREHLFDMDYLREGIHLRGFAQIDPLVAYKNEAFTLFGDLMNSVWTDYARMIFNVEVNVEGQNGAGAPPAAAASSEPAPEAPAAPETPPAPSEG